MCIVLFIPILANLRPGEFTLIVQNPQTRLYVVVELASLAIYSGTLIHWRMLNLTASTQEIALHLMKLRGQNTIAVVHNYGKVCCPFSIIATILRLPKGIWKLTWYHIIEKGVACSIGLSDYIYIHCCTIRVRLSVALFKYPKTTLNCNPYTCSLKIYATSYVF